MGHAIPCLLYQLSGRSCRNLCAILQSSRYTRWTKPSFNFVSYLNHYPMLSHGPIPHVHRAKIMRSGNPVSATEPTRLMGSRPARAVPGQCQGSDKTTLVTIAHHEQDNAGATYQTCREKRWNR